MTKFYNIHVDNLDLDFQIEFQDSETVEKLIEQLRREQNLNFKNVDVYCDNQILDGKSRLSEINSQNINVKLYFLIKINLQIQKRGFYENANININIYDKLGHVNKEIQNKFRNLNYQLEIHHNQSPLNLYQTLHQQSITQDCELKCIIKPQLQIEYEQEIYILHTILDEDYQTITKQIKQQLNLESEFQLIYNKQVINEYNYSNHQNQTLKLKIVDSVTLKILYTETQSFRVNKSILVQDLILYLKQLYSIFDDDDVSLLVENKKILPELTLLELNFTDNQLIKLVVNKKSTLQLINIENEKLFSKKQVKPPINLQFLKNLPQFKDRNIEFYQDKKKQQPVQNEIQDGTTIIIYYFDSSPQSQIYSRMQINFQNKETQEIVSKSIFYNEIIDKYIKELVGKDRVTLWLRDQEFTQENTFEGIGVKNNDVITYQLVKKRVCIVYGDQNYNIEILQDQTFENLKQQLLIQFNISKNLDQYQFFYNNSQIQLSEKIISSYKVGEVIYFKELEKQDQMKSTLYVSDIKNDINQNNLILKDGFIIDSTQKNPKVTIEKLE